MLRGGSICFLQPHCYHINIAMSNMPLALVCQKCWGVSFIMEIHYMSMEASSWWSSNRGHYPLETGLPNDYGGIPLARRMLEVFLQYYSPPNYSGGHQVNRSTKRCEYIGAFESLGKERAIKLHHF